MQACKHAQSKANRRPKKDAQTVDVMETHDQTLNDKSPHDDVGREETVQTAEDEADNELQPKNNKKTHTTVPIIDMHARTNAVA